MDTEGALFDPKGKRIGGHGAPTLIFSAQPQPFSPLTYPKGHGPQADGEVALLESTADKKHIALGDTVSVVGNGPRQNLRVVGLAKFGGVTAFGGAAVAVVTLPQAQRLNGTPGQLSEVSVAAKPGVQPAELRNQIRRVSPATVAVRTGKENADKNSRDIRDQLSFLRTALLAFAGISLFVGAFIIFNTFSITVAQRMREFALLRTLGASRRQVMGQVLAEGFVIGAIGSVVGLFAGLALAPVLRALFKAIGADLPSSGNVVETRTIVVSLLIGTIVTLVSGLVPAIRATHVPPVAALREGAVLPPSRGHRFVTPAGVVMAALGALALAAGLFGGAGVTLVGLGALLVFLGVAVLSPKLVPPLTAAVGRPLPGLMGRLARENAVRQPGRTAVTASALMVGVTLVAFVSIFAAGAKATIDDAINSALKPGALIVQNTDGFTPIPSAIGGALARVPGVRHASEVRYSTGKVRGVEGDASVAAVDPATLPTVFEIPWKDGSNATLRTLGDGGAIVSKGYADKHHLRTGSRLSVLTPTRKRVALTVRGVVDDKTELFGDLTVSNAVARAQFGQRQDALVLLDVFAPDAAATRKRIDAALDHSYPIAETLTAKEFTDRQAGQVDQLLALIYVLLSLAVIVSLFGIVNTLVLSIYERTRELGMLRAIGTSRRQVRRMIRYEAVITSLIGATIGIALGLVIAVAIAQPLKDDGFQLAIPVGQLVVVMILAAIAGVLAAILPARRAAKLDVLQALAYE
jgi:putative ABC transport system permease protein